MRERLLPCGPWPFLPLGAERWLAGSCPSLATPRPARPSVTCTGPHALLGWDLGEFGLAGWLSGGCGISAAGSALSPLRGTARGWHCRD